MSHLSEALALLAVLGMAAQWIGWRTRVPVILLLILFGLLIGPVSGLLRPSDALGEAFQPLIGLAAAVILFEGGLNLRIGELRASGTGVVRFIALTIVFGALFGAAAAHWITPLAWPVALTLGAVTVITGPTVILPLLRQARLRREPAAYLKWEGIVNDPAGAVLAVVIFQYFVSAERGSIVDSVLSLLLGLATAAALGFSSARLLSHAFVGAKVPEFLKGPTVLAAAMGIYAVSNLVHEEAGLVAATVLGVVLGNTDLPEMDEIRRFHAYVTLLLVSGLFLLLTADLRPAVMLQLDWRSAAFIAALVFLVRPLAVALATWGSGMPRAERILVGWIAPRGVIAVALAGVVGPGLADRGHSGAELLLPLVFALVFATIVLHGLSLERLARHLELNAPRRGGLLIAGANPWSSGLAVALHRLGVPVLLADRSPGRLRLAQHEGVPVYAGELSSQHAAGALELGEMETLLAATHNDAYNALLCSHYAPEFGRQRVYQLAAADPSEALRPAPEARGRTAFDEQARIDELERDWHRHYRFLHAAVTDDYGVQNLLADLPEEALVLAVIDADGQIALRQAGDRVQASPGSKIVWFACDSECPEQPVDDGADWPA